MTPLGTITGEIEVLGRCVNTPERGSSTSEGGSYMRDRTTGRSTPAIPNPRQRVNYRYYLWSAEWRARRARAHEIAGHRCQICASFEQLDVHHNTYERLGRERESDLIVLCRECHERHHGKIAPVPPSLERDWEAEKAEAVRKACDRVRAELLDYEWDGIDDRWVTEDIE